MMAYTAEVFVPPMVQRERVAELRSVDDVTWIRWRAQLEATRREVVRAQDALGFTDDEGDELVGRYLSRIPKREYPEGVRLRPQLLPRPARRSWPRSPAQGGRLPRIWDQPTSRGTIVAATAAGFTCAYAALRISEALGLRWRDLDFNAGTITVAGQLGTKGERLTTTKTPASASTLPMLPALRRELLAHRSRQASRNLALVHADALVFTTARGGAAVAPERRYAPSTRRATTSG